MKRFSVDHHGAVEPTANGSATVDQHVSVTCPTCRAPIAVRITLDGESVPRRSERRLTTSLFQRHVLHARLPAVMVSMIILLSVIANLVWLQYFRYGYPLDIDEVQFMA